MDANLRASPRAIVFRSAIPTGVLIPIPYKQQVVRRCLGSVRNRVLEYGAEDQLNLRDYFLDGIRPPTVPLQRIEGEGVGLYLPVPPLHLPRPAEVVKGLVGDQEHQNLVLAPEL